MKFNIWVFDDDKDTSRHYWKIQFNKRINWLVYFETDRKSKFHDWHWNEIHFN